MSKWMAVFAVAALLTVGCNSNKHHDDTDMGSEPKKMSTDACAHCPGNQTATADGKCPECGAKVK
jgi:hypothetical protein